MSQALNVALPQGLKRDIYAVPHGATEGAPFQNRMRSPLNAR